MRWVEISNWYERSSGGCWKNKGDELSGYGYLSVVRRVGKEMKLVEDDKACGVSDDLFSFHKQISRYLSVVRALCVKKVFIGTCSVTQSHIQVFADIKRLELLTFQVAGGRFSKEGLKDKLWLCSADITYSIDKF